MFHLVPHVKKDKVKSPSPTRIYFLPGSILASFPKSPRKAKRLEGLNGWASLKTIDMARVCGGDPRLKPDAVGLEGVDAEEVVVAVHVRERLEQVEAPQCAQVLLLTQPRQWV